MPLPPPSDYRSYPSLDSNASEKSHLPVSLGLCKSGDSNRTFADHEELCRVMRMHCQTNPYKEDDDNDARSTTEASAPACGYKPLPRGTEAEANTSVGSMDSGCSQCTIDDPDELRRKFQEIARNN